MDLPMTKILALAALLSLVGFGLPSVVADEGKWIGCERPLGGEGADVLVCYDQSGKACMTLVTDEQSVVLTSDIPPC